MDFAVTELLPDPGGGTVEHRAGVRGSIRREPRDFKNLPWVTSQSSHGTSNHGYASKIVLLVDDADAESMTQDWLVVTMESADELVRLRKFDWDDRQSDRVTRLHACRLPTSTMREISEHPRSPGGVSLRPRARSASPVTTRIEPRILLQETDTRERPRLDALPHRENPQPIRLRFITSDSLESLSDPHEFDGRKARQGRVRKSFHAASRSACGHGIDSHSTSDVPSSG